MVTWTQALPWNWRWAHKVAVWGTIEQGRGVVGPAASHPLGVAVSRLHCSGGPPEQSARCLSPVWGLWGVAIL